MQNKDQIKLTSKILEIITIAKPLSPNNSIYLMVFFILKFLGLIIFSSSFEEKNNMNLLSASNILRKITFFNTLTRSNLTFYQYEYILIGIYIILLIPIGLWLYFICIKKTQQSAIQLTEINLSNSVKIIIKIIMTLFIIIVFFSQHIIEYLLFPYSFLYPIESFSDKTIQDSFSKAKDSSIGGTFPLIIVNTIFVLLINIYVWFYFIWFNYPLLTDYFKFKFSFNPYYLFLLLFTFNFQGIHYYSLINDSFKLIMTSIGIIIALVLLILSTMRYVDQIYFNYLLLSLIYYSFYNGVITMISYYTLETNDEYLWKNCIIVLLIFANHFFMFLYQEIRLTKVIIHNIFLTNREIKGDYLYILCNLLKKCFHNPSNFSYILDLIEENQRLHENNQKNDIVKINLGDMSTQLKINKHNIDELNQSKRKMQFKSQYNSFVVLIETEIVNFIADAFRNKKINSQMRILLLHCDYIYYFKLNYSFSLYLIHQYLSKTNDKSFESIYNFYSLKNYVLKEKEKKKWGVDKFKPRFSNFLNYFQILSNIKELLYICCLDYQKVIALKKFCSEVKHHKDTVDKKVTLESLFDNCMKIDTSLRKLKNILLSNFTEDHYLKNPEMCFLLRNFYDITHKNVPEDILSCMLDISQFDTVLRFDSDFLDKQFEHPLIFTMESPLNKAIKGNKTYCDFKIFYISQKLTTYLGYKQSELINEDLQTLLPNEFAINHSIEMKKQLFISERGRTTKRPFILTKERYYIKINLISGLLPTLSKDTLIISDITIRHSEKDGYLFITDIDTNIITMTQNFSHRFNINFQMLNRLKISAGNFFNINTNKLMNHFKQNIDLIHNLKSESVENILNVFSQNSFVNLLDAYDKDNKIGDFTKDIQDSRIEKNKIFGIEQPKRKLIPFLQKAKKYIEELEYESSWLDRFDALINEFMSNSLKGMYDFKIHIKLHNIGDLPFYYIKVYDQSDEKYDINNSLNNKQDKILSIIPKSPGEMDFFKKYYENYQKISGPSSNNNNANNSLCLNDSRNLLISNHNYNFNNNPKGKSGFRKSKTIELFQINKFNKEISHHEIKHFNKSHKIKEKITGSISIFLMITIIILFFFSLFFKTQKLAEIEDQFSLVFDSIKIRALILETGILLTSLGLRSEDLDSNPYGDIDFTDEMVKNQIFIRSIEMFTYFNKYFDTVNKYYTDVNEIILKLTQKVPYIQLNQDFTVNSFNSSFEKEFYYYHFNCGFLNKADSFNQCRIKDHFLGKSIPSGGNDANVDERFYYYITHNIPKIYLGIINELAIISNEYVIKQCNQIESSFLIFNIISFITGFMIIISVFLIVFNYLNKMKFYLRIFLTKTNKTHLIENRIVLYKKMLESFEEDNCNNFEMKKDDGLLIPEQTNTTKNVLDKTNNETNKIKKKKIIQEKEEKNKKIGQLEESPEEAIYDSFNIFSLKILKLFMILISLATICFISLIMGSIVIDILLMKDIELAKEMAVVYIDRTPAKNDILFYYRISVLYNDINIFNVPKDLLPVYLFNFRTANSSLILNDQRYDSLNDSGMVFHYYRYNLLNRMNDYFERTNPKNLLPKSKAFREIEEKANACGEVAKIYDERIKTDADLFTQEFIEKACSSIDNGVLNKGIQTVIESYVSYVFDEYVDFSTAIKHDLLKEIQAPFATASIKIMTFVIDLLWHIAVDLIDEDLDKFFFNSRNILISFQLALFVLSTSLSIIFLFYLFELLKKKTDSYAIIIERIKDALI